MFNKWLSGIMRRLSRALVTSCDVCVWPQHSRTYTRIRISLCLWTCNTSCAVCIYVLACINVDASHVCEYIHSNGACMYHIYVCTLPCVARIHVVYRQSVHVYTPQKLPNQSATHVDGMILWFTVILKSLSTFARFKYCILMRRRWPDPRERERERERHTTGEKRFF